MTLPIAIALIACASWLYLILARGGFWQAKIHDDDGDFPEPHEWPAVAVVIPARNEAEMLGQSLPSLLQNDYPSTLHVTLIDDRSDDGTADVAKDAALKVNAADRLDIINGEPLPPGWAGKLWAVKQGLDAVARQGVPPKYLLLTDADIGYTPGVLQRLVARAEAGNLVMTSLMVKLHCRSRAERFLIPAFVFFFQMLYPFAWVNRRDKATAAAAGGCMLVRRDALEAAGGIEAIRGSLIDDCALGREMKSAGPVWLGLTQHVHSLRPYPAFSDIRQMVARSAYDQLGYSPTLLLSTVLGMILTYLAPIGLIIWGEGIAQALGVASWALMSVAFLPMVRFYRLSALWSLMLPLIAGVYMFFTIDSAVQFWRGKGGLWKGRVQARGAEAS